MKKHLLIVVVFLSFGAFLNNASAQANADFMRRRLPPVVDLRPQCNAILNRKRDGKFLLYGEKDGTKVFFTVKGGKPGPIEVFDKGGIALPAVRKRMDGGGGGRSSGACVLCYSEYGHWHCINIECSAL